MTTVTEQRILREAEEDRKSASNANLVPGGSPINGILKGGKLWKQQSLDGNTNKAPEMQQVSFFLKKLLSINFNLVRFEKYLELEFFTQFRQEIKSLFKLQQTRCFLKLIAFCSVAYN